MNSTLKKEMLDLKQECSNLDWDGYNANPMSEYSFTLAMKFAEALPPTLPVPVAAVDNIGRVFFQWGSLRRKFFSVRFEPNVPQRAVYKIGEHGRLDVHEVEYDQDNLVRLAEANV
jgi:hypothetical protein